MHQLSLPSPLMENWLRHQEHFRNRAGSEQTDWLDEILQDKQFAQAIGIAWGGSEFVATTCVQQPTMFQELVLSGDLDNALVPGELEQRLRSHLDGVASEEELLKKLRLFRNREMVRIVWRDFNRLAELEETTGDMTSLAEAVLSVTLEYLYGRACEEWGTPLDRQGNPQQMVILGMGKLGAWELNVSSDIDLIFTYPEAGETSGGKRNLSNQEFFVRLGQRLIKALDARTADGFVFRVDMRLRPYGQSGALVLNFDAMEEYYQTQGRDWERYAMIKARVVAGDQQAGRQLMTMLRPFTYRKYIDFSAFESLRSMKAMINREVQRKGLSADVKRGAGGIREVEFIAQAFQIIRGGRDSRFQTPELKAILPLIAEEGMLSSEEAKQLYEGYRFLRNVEHVLQGWQDRQTQLLPQDAEGQALVAVLMGYSDWSQFLERLDKHRSCIRGLFEDVVAEDRRDAEASTETQDGELAKTVWLSSDPECQMAEALAELGYDDVAKAVNGIVSLRDSHAVLAMANDTRGRLDGLMPRLIPVCGQMPNSAETLCRVLKLIAAVARRSAYLVLLRENPSALQTTVELFSASSWVADQLIRYPALLDELLDNRSLLSLPDRAALSDELRQQLLRIPSDDFETQMEVLRYFQRSHGLHVAACEVEGILPLMQVSDYLTWLAEAILEHVLEMAWEQLVARHGKPRTVTGEDAGFLIVGYGKLGGIELGHGSDLDLVFLHNADPAKSTDGEKAIDSASFFARLGQRIIHILTARLPSGDLYEVDMRLRPSGNSGMLVSSLGAFEKYQMEEAWIWEHQALVRARTIAGDESLAEQFYAIRERVLCRQRDTLELKQAVVEMRDKMRKHLGSGAGGQSGEGIFNLKQDAGGIVDIEFMVQFAVLAWSHDITGLTHWSDNIRILESLEESGVLSRDDAQCLISAYKKYRSAGHRLQLQQAAGVVDATEFSAEREQVKAVWQRLLG